MGQNVVVAAESLLSEIPGLEIATDVAVHLLLLGSAAFFAWIVFQVAVSDSEDRPLRVLAIFTGALIVIGADAAGLSYAGFVTEALGVNKPLTFGVFAVAVPAAGGTFLAWYLIWATGRSYNKAMRLFTLVGTLALVQFLLVYVEAATQNGLDIGAAVVPNLVFIVGFFLYMILNFEPGKAPKGSGLKDKVNRFVGQLSNKDSEEADARKGAGEDLGGF